jgi:hypothetical protein
MKNFKIFKKIGDLWWCYVGYPIYMRKLGKKTDKDLIDTVFIEIDTD